MMLKFAEALVNLGIGRAKDLDEVKPAPPLSAPRYFTEILLQMLSIRYALDDQKYTPVNVK